MSERFLLLLRCQLGQLVDCRDVRSLVVYITHEGPQGQPTLMAVGQWPSEGRALPAPDMTGELRVPAEERRWLPLRDGPLLLGGPCRWKPWALFGPKACASASRPWP
ncbi:MAG: hypothetical protein LW834_06110 [Cyanobium sp. 49614_E6]|nr:hypothetical protein [Cyanobium sp. 49614_E6]